MINLKNITLSSLTLFFILSNTCNAEPKNGTIVFPPADALKSYQYPPQTAIPPNFNRAYPQAPYVFGQNKNQQAFTPAIKPPQYNYGFAPQQRAMNVPPFAMPRPNNRYTAGGNNNFPFMNSMPFGNTSTNGFNPFSRNNTPFSGNSFSMPNNPMNGFFGNNLVNNNSRNFPFFKNNSNKKRKKAWGKERNIWPDFYTDFTDDAWDTVMSGPRDLGKMPGGWRFPYISMPDPVTVSDAITNQLPPIAEEAGNMADFSDWGVFDNK